MKSNRGLGRGLSALFTDTEESYQNATHPFNNVDKLSEDEQKNVAELKIDSVIANPNQPRKVFDEMALQELCDSIKKHGVITPIVVNKAVNGKYMIIAGERRYRASKMAGLSTIPAVVREYSDREVKEISLIENLQREDLNPIEAATAMKQLMDEYHLTQEELASCVGKSRPAVTNTMRLLTLCEEVISMIADGKISAGHARALITLEPADQIKIANEIVSDDLSVRDVERRVKTLFTPAEVIEKKKFEKNQQITVELNDFVDKMRQIFKTKVSLVGTDKKGRIYIDYYTKDDLMRIGDIVERASKSNYDFIEKDDDEF